MNRVYNCSSIEKICDRNFPVFTSNGIYPFDANVDCDTNLEDCFTLFENGCSIINVEDCPKNVKHTNPQRILKLRTHNGDIDEFCLTRQSNGPFKKYSLISYLDSEVIYLSDDSHIILMKEISHESTTDDVTCITFDMHYADLKTKTIKRYSFDVPDIIGLGSHSLALHGSQLFVFYDNPIKVFVVDFRTFDFYQWSSTGSASRFLTCSNVVVILDNHNFPKKFLCLTFFKGNVYEEFIDKPDVFLGKDKFELPMILNIKGKILWVAQNEDILVFLKLINNQLTIIISFPFNCQSNQNKINVMIKNIFCLNNSLLFVPMIGIDKNTVGSDCTADEYEIAVIDLHEIDIISILRTRCQVDIYTDFIDISSFNQGSSVVVKKLKKSTKKENDTFFGHFFHLRPASLQDMTMRVLRKKIEYEDIKDRCPSNIDLSSYYSC